MAILQNGFNLAPWRNGGYRRRFHRHGRLIIEYDHQPSGLGGGMLNGPAPYDSG
jgi:hypothetical protein